MAEFVQKKIEDFRPILEWMIKLELFNQDEIKGITKKMKDYEHKLQRHTKSKEDYLRYIQYMMDLLKLIKQRRQKYQISERKKETDFAIAHKVNQLYMSTIDKFQDDLRFWIAYMTFCKHVKFKERINRTMSRMLSMHQDKPKCWHIAARWEIEENHDLQTAKKHLLKGLHFHPESQLLYHDIFKLELDAAQNKSEASHSKPESNTSSNSDNSEIPSDLKKCLVIYEQASKRTKDIKFIIELLNTAQEYVNTEKLQERIVNDMVQEYTHEPLMWDIMARRELKGLVQPSISSDETPMEVDNSEQTSLRDRINNCYRVYQAAVKKMKSETMWSLFIDCMLEINQESDSLPNFKRKLLKNALIQGCQAKKLKEKYYLNWISMLDADQPNQDLAQSKLYEVLCWATEALPESENLWFARLDYLLKNDQEDLAVETFNKAVSILQDNSLRLWQLQLLHLQAKHSGNLENFFQEALNSAPAVSNYIKPIYIEWIVLTKDINSARKVYDKICIQPPLCLELHKKMATLELIQPEISLLNARRPHEMSTLQFGKENTDVWMELISFEIKYGDPTRISSIYNRAVKTLNPRSSDNFITEYALVKANSESLGIAV